MARWFASSRGAKVIAYEKTGHGRPVVFLHSGLADRSMWEPQRAAFAAHYTCYFVDSPGYGGSDSPPSPFSYPASNVEFIEEIVREPAALVGSSYGAGIAFETALIAPEWTGPLVLTGQSHVAGLEPSAELQALWRDADAAWERGDRNRAVEIEIEGWVDGRGRPGGQADEAVRDYFTAVNRAIWERHAAHPLPELLPGPTHDYTRVQQPVLLMDGPYDLPDVHASSQALFNRLPNAEYVSIAGAAHFPNRERPDEFNRVVLDFLDRTWGSAG
jgi:pimeloyl-ACP methyl ester carboxylesterase